MFGGELEKFKIIAFEDGNFSLPAGPPFIVQVNPENYSVSVENVYNERQGPGFTKPELQYSYTPARRMEFEFLFDGSGAIPTGGSLNPLNAVDVNLRIELFKSLVIDYSGAIHQPRFLILFWGTLLFKCKIINLDINYKVFRHDGIPIRATARCIFEEHVPAETSVLSLAISSPDLTHVRTVLQGDTLPLMCYKIYGDAKHYLEVAKANRLDDFTNLQAGQKIFFPPLEK